MSDEPELPENGRLIAAGLVAASLVALLLNHFAMQGTQSVTRMFILAVGPIGVFLGIGGIVEPKILWSVGKYGTHLPAKYKIIGGILGAIGLVVALVLVFFVYDLGQRG